MAISGSGSASNYTTRTFGPFTRGGVSPWSRTTGLQVTLSCWVRCRAAPSGLQTFFGIGNFAEVTFFQLLVDTNFVFRAWYANTSGGAQATALSASNAAAVGDWVHLMATLDCTSNPRATLYIGGATYTAASGADSSGSTFNNVTLHRRPSSSATTPAPTTTDVAEVAVYAGLLSAADAAALRCGQNPVSVEGHRLLAYFPLRDNVQDRSPYGVGLTHSAAYALAWSDHPPVQQEPRRRLLRASSAAPVEVTPLGIYAQAYTGSPAVAQNHAATAASIVAQSYTGSSAATQNHAAAAASIFAQTYTGSPRVNPAALSAPTHRTVTWPYIARAARWIGEARTVTWPAEGRTVTWRQ